MNNILEKQAGTLTELMDTSKDLIAMGVISALLAGGATGAIAGNLSAPSEEDNDRLGTSIVKGEWEEANEELDRQIASRKRLEEEEHNRSSNERSIKL